MREYEFLKELKQRRLKYPRDQMKEVMQVLKKEKPAVYSRILELEREETGDKLLLRRIQQASFLQGHTLQTATPTEVTALKKEVDAVRQQLARREDLTLSKLQALQREGLDRTRELISQSVASQKRLRDLDRRQEDNNLLLS